jgi:DNA repair exonuclease SbcCD ATPase subunit
MRRVELISITLENFRSFRKRTTFELSPTSGLKFISGDNQVQPRLGANGAGKSTLWDALAFCLYNASVKGIRPSDLLSWGEKQSYVKTEWLIAGEPATIERYSAPNRITINGKPVEQITVDRLIGLSRLRFLQGIVFGQGMPLFIDLSVPERGALLDEVLDLGIWLKLSEDAGRKHAALNQELQRSREDIARLSGKLETLQDTTGIERELAAWDAQQGRRIDLAIAQVEEAEQGLAGCAAKVVATKSAVDALADTRAMHNKLTKMIGDKSTLESAYRQLFKDMEAHTKTRDFYAHNKTCPTCAQGIPMLVSEKRRNEAESAARNIKARIQANGGASNQLTAQINELEAEYSSLSRKREFLVAQHATAQANLANQQRIIEGAIKAAEAVADAPNPHQARLDGLRADRQAVEVALKAANGIVRRGQGAAMRAEFWKAAFKRVRLFLVKRVLAQLELETATSAIALGLVGWRISFSTELENKSGTIRPGIFIQVASPDSSAPWEAWSGGEAQRIRLAVAIGLASMIQRLAGISLSFEVWDEPGAWLSDKGMDDLLDCLKHRVETTGKSLWLCSHSALIYSGFDETWQVTKDAAGSLIKQLR